MNGESTNRSKIIVKIRDHFMNQPKMGIIKQVLALSDVDECSLDPSPCDENAACTNSEGSFICACQRGFTGNGTTCKGMTAKFIVLKFVTPLSLLKPLDREEFPSDPNPCDS